MSPPAFKVLLSLLNPWQIVANLWRHRDLIWQFTLREIHVRHKGSRLGLLWTLINPLSMLVLYATVFRLFFRSGFGVLPNETTYDYALALWLSLSLFHVFAETLGWSPVLITSNPSFVKKVVFPLEVLPVAKMGDAAFHLSVSLALVLIGNAFRPDGLSWSLLWLPVLVLPLFMFVLGLAWGLAAIGVFVRDVSHAIAFVTTAAMFASAVPYSVKIIHQGPPFVWDILRLNPLLQIVELGRSVLLWHQPVAWLHLGYVYAFGLGSLLAGHVIFGLLRRSFAEVI